MATISYLAKGRTINSVSEKKSTVACNSLGRMLAAEKTRKLNENLHINKIFVSEVQLAGVSATWCVVTMQRHFLATVATQPSAAVVSYVLKNLSK